MLRVFIGYDHRQPLSYNVLQHSIVAHSSKPVSITPLVYNTLPITRKDGLTPFTFSRFFVPWLCNYEDIALFLDIDMLLVEDIAQLFELFDPRYTVQVIKNPLKYEWASAMLFNCAQCKILTPDYINSANGLHQISWANPDEIGELPGEWNHLVGYDKPRPDAKLVHYTQGIPAFEQTIECEYSTEWHTEHQRINSTVPWEVLMGQSVHAVEVDGKKVPRLAVKS